MDSCELMKQLTFERSKDAEVLKKPAYSGIIRLLTDLYPDNAHFIYELLQNAEDPEATEVKFNLSDSSVEFIHNGKRQFSFKDVESITSIGNSTKRDDATSIGKFGVGFKAVFAYTNTPEIHSGDFHFRIRDLVVPDTDGVKQSASNQHQTSFIFPFDNPKKPAEIAVQEIAKGLRALGDNTLLFLSHIRKIEYSLPDGAKGSLERIDQGNGRIDIRVCKPHSEATVSHWLHFEKDVEVTDDDGIAKTCRIAIAYSLVEETNKKTEEKIWKIVPISHGQVSIYFPAEKETSNLKFHLHAPFASTVARDSVRDCPANEQLRDHLAELIIESLTAIRDQDLLTVSFLAVLPNHTDNVPVFYEPIRLRIIEVFRNSELTPTRAGKHAPAERLFRGPSRIANLINDEDLSVLTNYEPPLWAANPPPQSLRAENFLDNLKMDKWGFHELASSFAIFESDHIESIENWLHKKSDTWLLRFYSMMGDAISNNNEVKINKSFSIVRVSGYEEGHTTPGCAFFPSNQKDVSPPSGTYFVKPEVYQTKGIDFEKVSAKIFLECIGVRTLDLDVLFEEKLEQYSPYYQSQSVNAEYFKDLKFFINYWLSNQDYWEYDRENFSKRYILLDANEEWMRPNELCLDEPYLNTSLGLYENVHGKKILWPGYTKKLTDKQLKNFIEFARAIGVKSGLEIIAAPLYKNEKYWSELLKDNNNGVRESRSTCIKEDYSIEFIEKYLASRSLKCYRLIWDALINADKKVSKARYRVNSKYSIRESDSQLIFHLKNYSWIPNKQGKFCNPRDMTRDDLPRDFPYDDRNGLLTAIGFGENARKHSEEYQAKNKKAQEIGFESAEQAAQFAELAKNGFSPEQWLAQQKTIEQPEKSVPNPDRRRKGVLERSENAPIKESVMRERSIQPDISTIQEGAKAYLRSIYTNKNGEMVCQCCKKEMPFKIGDDYYFEAVQCFKNAKNQYIENRLALCPVCAAMYQYARQTDDKEIQNLIITNDSDDDATSVEISITLTQKKHTLRFVGSHWFDLKSIILSTK